MASDAQYNLKQGNIHLDVQNFSDLKLNHCLDLTIAEAEELCLTLFNALEDMRLEKENG